MKRLLIPTLLGLTALISIIPPSMAGDSLVIYSGRSDKFVKPVLADFTRQTGIDVTLHSGDSTALLNKLRIEGERTEADLFLSNDAGNLQQGSDWGLFRPIDSQLLTPIDKNYRAADHTWVGLSARARVLVVNTQGPWADTLDSIFDLADPALRGKLGITNSTNGSYIAGVTVVMLAAGADKTRQWLQGMKDNVDGKVFNKHSKLVSAVASGKLQAGLVNHYYIYRHLDAQPDAPIKMVMPDQSKGEMGIAWNVAGIAITGHSRKAALAEKLIAFLISEAGQRQFAEVNLEYPTRTSVAASAQLPPAGSFRVADVPMSALGTQRDVTLDLIEQVGMP